MADVEFADDDQRDQIMATLNLGAGLLAQLRGMETASASFAVAWDAAKTDLATLNAADKLPRASDHAGAQGLLVGEAIGLGDAMVSAIVQLQASLSDRATIQKMIGIGN